MERNGPSSNRSPPSGGLRIPPTLPLPREAAIPWNTVYLEAAIDRLRSEGVEIDDETLAHLSPAHWEHISPYGRFHFDVEAGLGRKELRPLRDPQLVA